MSMNVNKTIYGDYQRILKRAYKDIDELNNLLKYAKGKTQKQKYQLLIDDEEIRIKKYEKYSSIAYEQWDKDMKTIWKFGDFWGLIEGNDRWSLKGWKIK